LKINLKTQDVAVIGVCAALYAVVGRLTAGVTFLGVGLLPAVVIPAVFAVLYGPWVGGIGGAIGIFIRDMFVHGNALLSLAAGVPPNFILFFLIGYIAARNIDTKKIVVSLAVSVAIVVAGLIVPALIYPTELSIAAGGLSIAEILLVFGLTVILSIVVISAVAIRWKQWRSFAIAALIGQTAGAALLSVTIWAVSPLFLSYFKAAVGPTFILPLFVWTFATEIPFILLVGPPIIKACYGAFPSLRLRSQRKGEIIE
jgi:uncharacterized membrane protein